MYFHQASLLPYAISDLYAEVCESGQITMADRLVLRVALVNNFLSEDELVLIDRMFYFVRRGGLKMLNEF